MVNIFTQMRSQRNTFTRKTNHKKEVEAEKHEIDIQQCLQCTEIRFTGGTFKCYREKCKYDGGLL